MLLLINEQDDEYKELKDLLSTKLTISMVMEDDLDRYKPDDFENFVFWLTDVNHISIEERLIRDGFKVNADFCSVAHLCRDDYSYLCALDMNNKYWDAEDMGPKGLEEYFCPIPFERFFVYSKKANLCCPGHINDVSVGDLQSVESIDEVWNSSTAKLVRESVLSGSYYFCNEKKCKYLYSGLLPKKEEVENPFYRKIIDENLLEISGGPTFMNIGIDSMCNLSCRMCRDRNVRNPYETKECLDDIIEKLKQYQFTNLKKLLVAGNGEVFLNASYHYILDNIDMFHMPNLREIVLKTNGVLLDKQVQLIRKLSEKYKVSVSISVDAVSKETYLMVRRGSNHEKLLHNMKLLKELRKENVVGEIEYSFCIQRCNVWEVEEFMDMAKEYGADAVQLQQIMGSRLSESVQSEKNVYHDIFIDLVNKSYQRGKELGIEVRTKPVRKHIKFV